MTWILAALGVISALASLAQTQPALTKVLSIVGGLIDIAIIVLLAQKPSGEYFKSRS